MCLEGFDASARSQCEKLKKQKETIYDAEINRLASGNLQLTGGIQWFHVGERFDGMGVKMIGDFCRFIREKPFIVPDAYIAGFQPVPDRVPGLGDMNLNAVKVSMRVSPILEALIHKGDMPGLDKLLPEATRVMGGFTDACHSLAAATTIPPGKEAQLADTMNALLNDWLAHAG